jgi:hypothetical protein
MTCFVKGVERSSTEKVTIAVPRISSVRTWFLIMTEGLIRKLSEFACFVFRPEAHRQENGLTDERKAISQG